MSRLFTALLFVTSFLSASFGTEKWNTVYDVKNTTGNLSFSTHWQGEKGIRLKLAPPDSNAEVSLSINRKEARIKATPPTAFPPAIQETPQYDVDGLPALETNILITLKLRPEYWALYINDRMIVNLPAPFTPPALVSQPEYQSTTNTAARFQKTEDIRPLYDQFLVPLEESNSPAGWEKESGAWALHTAVDSSMERGNLKEKASKVPTPDHSPNFYCLMGKGTNAVITAGYPYYDSYILEAAMRIVPGEMGLVFHHNDNAGYHAFTLEMLEDCPKVLCRLWNTGSTSISNRTILDAALLDLTPDQWIQVRVITHQDRVQCYVDNTLVFDRPANLPPGGRFGLFATSSTGVQFDDVSAQSHHRPDLSNIRAIRRHTIAQEGDFIPRRFFGLLSAHETDTTLAAGKSRKPQWLILGSPAHKEHLFAADFIPSDTSDFCVGLISGYTGTNQPYYRFICRRKDDMEHFILETVSGNSISNVETAAFPAPVNKQNKTTLMLDGAGGRELRMYKDNTLVLVHQADKPSAGASGLYVAPGTKTEISNLVYDSKQQDEYTSRFEKNPLFVDDAFMRHWSSPEGEWLPMTNGLIWNKSDFLGRFLIKLPFVPGSQIHLGVEEGSTNGTLIVIAETNRLLLVSGPTNNKNLVSTLVDTNNLIMETTQLNAKEKGPPIQVYTINYEGHWLWVTSGDNVLFKHALSTPLQGHHVRLSGFSTNNLRNCYVKRWNVKDFLFTESPFEWQSNGGLWSVVNRFNCQPQWSHMNGESTNGLAALWTKYEYGGDFCMEMYAGMRHGWYERPGDLNMTILASDTSPSKGYTVTCTGWDPDHSQLYTRLYRDGKEIAISDKYLVPRTREGEKRKGFTPFVADGRDIHGAWYYMKFRRTGNRVEYYFDNELVFAVDDDQPPEKGMAGIWTFMNSMMVARVKIAAERISSKPLQVEPVTNPASFKLASLLPKPSGETSVLKDGAPVFACTPSVWQTDDPTGLLRMNWHRDGMASYFSTHNVLGSGDMLTRCKLPPKPCTKLAGWRFLVKRTDAAQFNFLFSIGRMKNGTFTTNENFSYRLSGPDPIGESRSTAGATLIPGIASAGRDSDWHQRGEWTPVTVWIPPLAWGQNGPDSTNLYVKAEGFGIGQPCIESAGLHGNAPGSGYAIRDFTEIGYQPPVFTDTNEYAFSVKTDWPHKQQAGTNLANVAALQEWVAGITNQGLVTAELTVPGPGTPGTGNLLWLNQPDTPLISCHWSTKKPNAVEIAKAGGGTDVLFGSAVISIGGITMPLDQDGLDVLRAMVPRMDNLCLDQTNAIPVAVHMGTNIMRYSIAWNDNPLKQRPVLLDLDGAAGYFENFERQVEGRPLTVNRITPDSPEARNARDPKNKKNKRDAPRNRSEWKRQSGQDAVVRVQDDSTNRYIEVSNDGHPTRLRTTFAVPCSLIRYPLLGFEYRGTGMVNVSVDPGKNHAAKLSESFGREVPLSKPLLLDNKWHYWLGDISTVISDENPAGKPFQMSRLQFGSAMDTDQTGLFSRWDLNDLVMGPAVSCSEQLTLTADYFEFGGIESVSLCVRQGIAGYYALSEDEQKGLKWKLVDNRKEAAPDLEGLADGVCHLFLKAHGRNGLDSGVTDIPFLLDREAPSCSFEFEKDETPEANGTTLKVAFKSKADLAPIDFEQIRFGWDSEIVELDAVSPRTRVNQQGTTDLLYLNWPLIFRKQLNVATNGQTSGIVISGITDGAGNESPDLSIPLTIDYAKDKRSPTVLSTKMPSNVLWYIAWKKEGESAPPPFIKPIKESEVVSVWPTNEEPYVTMKARKAGGAMQFESPDKPWMATNAPYVSFRIRYPKWTNDANARLDMIVELGDEKTAIIGLTPSTSNDENRILLPDPLPWKPDCWHEVTVDLLTLLKDKLPEKILETKKIRALRFSLSGNEEKTSIDLQSLCIYSDWKETDTVELDTYDASGMAGTVICENTGEPVDPEDMVPDSTPRWRAMYTEDKAGNASRPFRFVVWNKKPAQVEIKGE